MGMNDFRATLAINLLCARQRKDQEFDAGGAAEDAVKTVDAVLKACGIDKGEDMTELRRQLNSAESMNAILTYKIDICQKLYEEVLALAEGRSYLTLGSPEFWKFIKKIRDGLTATEFNINKSNTHGTTATPNIKPE